MWLGHKKRNSPKIYLVTTKVPVVHIKVKRLAPNPIANYTTPCPSIILTPSRNQSPLFMIRTKKKNIKAKTFHNDKEKREEKDQ